MNKSATFVMSILFYGALVLLLLAIWIDGYHIKLLLTSIYSLLLAIILYKTIKDIEEKQAKDIEEKRNATKWRSSSKK